MVANSDGQVYFGSMWYLYLPCLFLLLICLQLLTLLGFFFLSIYPTRCAAALLSGLTNAAPSQHPLLPYPNNTGFLSPILKTVDSAAASLTCVHSATHTQTNI